MRHIIIPAILAAITGAAVFGSQQFGADKRELITFDPAKAQVVEWQKPTTDAEWAEDVKAGQFHMRSSVKLDEIETAHVDKLKRVQDGQREIIECPECIKFKARQANPEWSAAEVDAYYSEQLAHAHWEIENLTQNVERIQNEKRLRRTGFVIVPSEGDTQPLFGSINAQYVRDTIID